MNIKKVLILGSGALKIGQAGEFDYSGSQAIKALKEDGIKSIVINPNIATVQTSDYLADEVYFLPVNPYFVEKVIEKEKPDGILLSFGGQTALNCGVELHTSGVLKKHTVSILGSPIESIILTEDREKFARHLTSIHQSIPESIPATTMLQAQRAAEKIGYPVMIRAAFALGGQSSGIVHTPEELKKLCQEAFSFAPQVLVERYLHHFKEIEYEVVRDHNDNCITVCNMENFDPLGIHTGESIVIAPSQTLNNFEYHTLRQASIDIIRSLGIIGECNIQYALNPKPKNKPIEYYVIEVNARLSRSSALASKATGYPLAYVAAKLALGKTLNQIPNQVTRKTQSFFEPALDYCVVKIPRWDIEKFRKAHEKIGSSMKSVGEVMGIGRSFTEAVQKAVRMLEIGVDGITDHSYLLRNNNGGLTKQQIIDDHVIRPTPRRLFALTYLMQQGYSIDTLHDQTGIDPWFLNKLNGAVQFEKQIASKTLSKIDAAELRRLKQFGFSDQRIAITTKTTENQVRERRKKDGVVPSVFQIDTLAAEFPAQTNYLYLTYHGEHHDVEPHALNGVMVLGSGPYRIGSSVEFDWSCVSAARRLVRYGKKSIIVNCNPETVSTDYDMSDRLYFEELSLERVLDIYDFEQSQGVIISVGGQTPNNLAIDLKQQRVPVMGTDPTHIDRAEDRNTFSKTLDKLHIQQPAWIEATTVEQVEDFAKSVGYPVLVRPSYVLSGSAMSVCSNLNELKSYLERAVSINKSRPVTVSKFYEGAKEIELDAVAWRGALDVYAISEHVEFAGVHSGDATIVFPAQRVYETTKQVILDYARRLARTYQITGPFNIQFLALRNEVAIIEMNLRASRTFPLLSKATGINFAEKVVDAFFDDGQVEGEVNPPYSVVKVPQFSFARLTGADPVLDVEMNSTGEVGCFGEDVDEAFLKSMLSVGYTFPQKNILVSIGDWYKEQFALKLLQLHEMRYTLYATEGTARFMKQKFNIPAIAVKKGREGTGLNVLSLIEDKKVEVVINIRDRWHKPADSDRYRKETTDGYLIRRTASDHNISSLTDVRKTSLFVSALARKKLEDLQVKSWREYLESL
ncbi:carbamoyl-phosphate synthase (glutamine-hydrolyzing) large subunit [Candidatus Roizmanbacteria bacterium]|nr:carbamoyl-phosphate synthase (glutamine-hydrolyzing) large subunit [Candidatus Roizmanbacteria bacterium]